MLSKFQAMKRVNAQPVLPQSESGSAGEDTVHLGNTSALSGGLSVSRKQFLLQYILVMHVLVPTLPNTITT